MIPDYEASLKQYIADLFAYDIHPNQIKFEHKLGQYWIDEALGIEEDYFNFEVFFEPWDCYQFIDLEEVGLKTQNFYISFQERYCGFYFEQNGVGFDVEMKIRERETDPAVKCSYCGSPWLDEPLVIPDIEPKHIKKYRARENTIDVFYCIECKKYFVREYRGEWYHDDCG